jgi:hypothetical protein
MQWAALVCGAPTPVTAVQPGASLAGKLSAEAVSNRSLADAVSVGWGGVPENRLNILGDLFFMLGTPWG